MMQRAIKCMSNHSYRNTPKTSNNRKKKRKKKKSHYGERMLINKCKTP